MKHLRFCFALLAIGVLIAAAVVPGGMGQFALLAAVLLLLPVAPTVVRQRAVIDSSGAATPDRAPVFLRAPPVTSTNR